MRWLAAVTSIENRTADRRCLGVRDRHRQHAHWVDGVSEAILTPEADAAASGLDVGTPFMSQYTYAGRTHTMEYVVTVLERPATTRWSHRGPPTPSNCGCGCRRAPGAR